MMSFSMNCDALPPSRVTFLEPLPELEERSGVVLHPLFKEVSRSASTYFAIKVPGATNVVIARDQPYELTDGVELVCSGSQEYAKVARTRKLDGITIPGSKYIFEGHATFTSPGPIYVWARTVTMNHDDATGQIITNVSPFFPCVEFEVLSGRAGWDDLAGEFGDDAVLDVMLAGDDGGVALESLPEGAEPAVRDPEFDSRRGMLYAPLAHRLPVGRTASVIEFRLKLPGAVAVVVSKTKPVGPNDGIVLFKTSDGVFAASLDPSANNAPIDTSPGLVYVWAQLTDTPRVSPRSAPSTPMSPAPASLPATPAPSVADPPLSRQSARMTASSNFVSILDDVDLECEPEPQPESIEVDDAESRALDALLGITPAHTVGRPAYPSSSGALDPSTSAFLAELTAPNPSAMSATASAAPSKGADASSPGSSSDSGSGSDSGSSTASDTAPDAAGVGAKTGPPPTDRASVSSFLFLTSKPQIREFVPIITYLFTESG
ncbi:uncharacterized protein AMSG_12108 [Thecamonas trahens ATCC 50062]|uniref:Uncharacterized protein n=1 Tax=Thecamonas trahens ATCC 50062 TaxID=461836 RepID=A0A0L0DHF3_THETB|nr:hypothetical protein AMSG_12108 [Thecamonas trahens ATCC 50062]KNC51794.1 hypothetical protein AMSG_12108 [Thecamonas trahens ATCC 50062]|eukprot:XP_013755766.1 hypothetical protein AMSG_12108 [Thecamonas trahens ATCC 50062]